MIAMHDDEPSPDFVRFTEIEDVVVCVRDGRRPSTKSDVAQARKDVSAGAFPAPTLQVLRLQI
jgi:hypothetical protein